MASRAMWVWLREGAPVDADALAGFARQRRVSDAFVSVPWAGPEPGTRRCVEALRGAGVRVTALGGDPGWATSGDARGWARRATATGLFDGVHLDIEPWGRADWPGNERRLLAGLERAVREVAATTRLPVEVDLAPWLADEHPLELTAIARWADAVTLMAYRDRAGAILALSAAARSLLASTGTAFRVGVETGPVRSTGPAPGETFADDGSAVLERELAAVVAELAGDARFVGIAVHDAAGWRALRL